MQTIIALIRDSKKIPAIREVAEDVIQNVTERNWLEEIKALFNYVKANIRYTQDIENVEMVKTPLKHITDIRDRGITYGDCDDATALLGALLVSVGYVVKVVIIKSEKNKENSFNHIYLYAQVPHSNTWISLDATAKDKPFGFETTYRERKTYEV